MKHVGYLVVARADVPELDIAAGDVLRYDPCDPPHFWTHHRRRRFDHGAVLVALNEGALAPIDIMPAAVSVPSSPPRPVAVLPLQLRRPRPTG